MKRRAFIKTVSSAAGAAALGVPRIFAESSSTKSGLPRRMLGRASEKLSVVGFPGLALVHYPQEKCTQALHEAFERGINYFDVAPTYGNAEERLGPALEPHRKRVFPAGKTGKRTAAEAEAELHRSLELLRTDHVDLYQHHGVTTLEEVETIMGPGGAMETFVKAREKGLARFLGFSAHGEAAALALMDRFTFDSVLFPFNWACWLKHGFGEKVMHTAQKKGMARLALKTLAKRTWAQGEEKPWPKCWYKPVDTYEEAVRAVRFTLSKPVTAALSPGHADLLEWLCDAAEHARPLSSREEEALAEEARGLDTIFPQ
jgi:predicted aldo/keto reductase-like oxidoreductase